MSQLDEPTNDAYPLGRGYGHDYMRGGEVLGGYGYSQRQEYERRRGELTGDGPTRERRRADEDAAPEAGGDTRSPGSQR